MDFSFTDEQNMLREQARAWLADKFPIERVAELADSEGGWDPQSWPAMAELGWIGLSSPEAAGGAGMSFLEEAVLFEEIGRALYPGPYWSSVALALPALEANSELAADVISGRATATLAWAESSGPASLADASEVGCKAEGDGDEWRLTGEKALIPDAGCCDVVVVVARSADGFGLWAVRDAGLDVVSTMDSTRRLGRLELRGEQASALTTGPDAGAVVERIRLRALAALALEAVGVAEHALDLASEHATTRTQFDRPIGAYQAVSHKVADTYADVELARSLAYWAAWCVAHEPETARLAVPAAKALAAEAAVAACERSIQVHGGIGFTWEHPLHRYYKRAQWIESFEGHPRTHRAEVAQRLLDRGEPTTSPSDGADSHNHPT
jgi:alkylation response protein AidB-like acyl-CoA dehydrogenase